MENNDFSATAGFQNNDEYERFSSKNEKKYEVLIIDETEFLNTHLAAIKTLATAGFKYQVLPMIFSGFELLGNSLSEKKENFDRYEEGVREYLEPDHKNWSIQLKEVYKPIRHSVNHTSFVDSCDFILTYESVGNQILKEDSFSRKSLNIATMVKAFEYAIDKWKKRDGPKSIFRNAPIQVQFKLMNLMP